MQLVMVDAAARPDVTFIVSAPPRTRGTTLGAEAFTLSVAGSPVPVTAAPVPPSSRTVAVVVDTSAGVTAEALDRERAAAAELLRSLDPGTNLTLLTTVAPFVVVDATTDTARAMAALGGLGIGGRAELDRVLLQVSAGVTGPAGLARTVLLTADPAIALQRDHGTDASTVEAIVLDPAPAAALQGRGAVVQAGGPSGLAAVDALAGRLTNQYAIRASLPAAATGPVQLGVNVSGHTYPVAVDLPVPPPPTTVPAPAPTVPTTAAPATTPSRAPVVASAAVQPTQPATQTAAKPAAVGRPPAAAPAEGPEQSILSSPLRWVFLGACAAGVLILAGSLTFRSWDRIRLRRARKVAARRARRQAERDRRRPPLRVLPSPAELRGTDASVVPLLSARGEAASDPQLWDDAVDDAELLAILERLRREVSARSPNRRQPGVVRALPERERPTG